MLWNIKCELQTGLLKSRRSPLSHHNTEARQSAGRWASLAWSPRKYYTVSGPATSLTPSCFPPRVHYEGNARALHKSTPLHEGLPLPLVYIDWKCWCKNKIDSHILLSSPKIHSKQYVSSLLQMEMTVSPEVKEAINSIMYDLHNMLYIQQSKYFILIYQIKISKHM